MEKDDSQKILEHFGLEEEFKPVNEYTEEDLKKIAYLLYQNDEMSKNDNE